MNPDKGQTTTPPCHFHWWKHHRRQPEGSPSVACGAVQSNITHSRWVTWILHVTSQAGQAPISQFPSYPPSLAQQHSSKSVGLERYTTDWKRTVSCLDRGWGMTRIECRCPLKLIVSYTVNYMQEPHGSHQVYYTLLEATQATYSHF